MSFPARAIHPSVSEDMTSPNPQPKAARPSAIRSMRNYSGLLTDLYELTMAAGYLQTHFDARATFELFVRHLPPRRNYLVAAGLEQALEFLENVQFHAGGDRLSAAASASSATSAPEFFDYLAKFRFTGDVWAMPEGTLVFPGRAAAARHRRRSSKRQIVETYLLATLSYQTMIASKAARVVHRRAGPPSRGFRRAPRPRQPKPAFLPRAPRSIGGCVGTSNVLAGREFGMDTYGTQAHSWVMAHDGEVGSLRAISSTPFRTMPLCFSILTTCATRSSKILPWAASPPASGSIAAIVAKDSRWVRRELDRAGWNDVKVFASGDLDEYRIA